MWQIDDDSFFRAPLGFDLVQHMRDGNLSLAAKQTYDDIVEVTRGLPELTRYHIEVERLQPTTLLDHCRCFRSWPVASFNPNIMQKCSGAE